MLDEIIALEDARSEYGVVLKEIDDGYGWTVDPAATAKLRGEMS